jgi:hypothetical protein
MRLARVHLTLDLSALSHDRPCPRSDPIIRGVVRPLVRRVTHVLDARESPYFTKKGILTLFWGDAPFRRKKRDRAGFSWSLLPLGRFHSFTHFFRSLPFSVRIANAHGKGIHVFLSFFQKKRIRQKKNEKSENPPRVIPYAQNNGEIKMCDEGAFPPKKE